MTNTNQHEVVKQETQVKRWIPDEDGYMEEHADGDYVLSSDYASVVEERDRLRKELVVSRTKHLREALEAMKAKRMQIGGALSDDEMEEAVKSLITNGEEGV